MFSHTDKSTWLNIKDRTRPLVPIISPSLLACDFAQLLSECNDVLSPEGGACEWLHVDIMDGHFVPNITIGPCVVQAVRKHLPQVFLDCHLMVSHPEKWVTDFAKAGASQFTFHIEATENAEALCEQIRAAGMQVGVTLKPKTEITNILPLISKGLVDMVLVMTVEPGFGGQSFMHDQLEKVKAFRQACSWLNIEVDGGLDPSNVGAAAEAGANVIVAGTSIFRAKSRKDATNALRDAVAKVLSANTKAENKL